MSDPNAALKPQGRSGIGRYKEENVNKFPYEAFTTSVNTSYPRTLTVQSNWNFAVTGDIYNVHDTESIDISSGNQNIDLDDFSGKSVGYTKEYIVSGGDGTYTCTTTNNGSFTLDGVALSSLSLTFHGQGRVIWQLVATNTLRSRGPEIWDSDGGNFTYSWEKHIDNKLYQYGELTSNGTDNNTVTFDITFAAIITYSLQTSGSAGTGTIINRVMLADTVSTSSIVVRAVRTDSGGLAGTFTGTIAFVAFGTWTASYPL